MYEKQRQKNRNSQSEIDRDKSNQRDQILQADKENES
jgi:hypothetical protein